MQSEASYLNTPGFKLLIYKMEVIIISFMSLKWKTNNECLSAGHLAGLFVYSDYLGPPDNLMR